MEHAKHMFVMPLLIGIVIILARLYTQWDIWIVLGVILIVKAVMMLVHPDCYKGKKR